MTVLMDVVDRLWLRMAPVIASWSQQADADDFTEHHIIVIDRLKKRMARRAQSNRGRYIYGGRENKTDDHEAVIFSIVVITPSAKATALPWLKSAM